MNKFDEQIKYWQKSAERNWKTAVGLFNIKHHEACLFFCHLTIEKLLKGMVVQNNHKAAPCIHNLEKLAALTKLILTKEQIHSLRVITYFNMGGRYDNIKFAFYKKCNRDYTKKYFEITKQLRICLKKQFLKN